MTPQDPDAFMVAQIARINAAARRVNGKGRGGARTQRWLRTLEPQSLRSLTVLCLGSVAQVTTCTHQLAAFGALALGVHRRPPPRALHTLFGFDDALPFASNVFDVVVRYNDSLAEREIQYSKMHDTSASVPSMAGAEAGRVLKASGHILRPTHVRSLFADTLRLGVAPYAALLQRVAARASAPSTYEQHQASKIGRKKAANNAVDPFFVKLDRTIEAELGAHLGAHLGPDLAPRRALSFAGKRVLCVGARLGGEVRAFARLGALAVGVDFNPGPRNSWSLWGDATMMQFANGTFDFLYSNILDHIQPEATFAAEAARLLTPGTGRLLAYADLNPPDDFSVRDFRQQGALDGLQAVWLRAGFVLEERVKYGPRTPLSTAIAGTVGWVLRRK